MEEPDLDVYMVGDVRQSVFDTNPQDPNLRQYRGVNMLDWFELYQTKGLLEVQHNAKTWRANQTIATFSDTLFPSEFTFEPTVSMQNETTDHDGVFALSEPDVPAYILQHSPQLLRNSISTVCALELPIHNFGKVKGLTFDRVLIYPTKSIINFLVDGTELAPKTACGLYVAVTRAKYSVAFVLPKPSDTALTHWGESNSPERASTT